MNLAALLFAAGAAAGTVKGVVRGGDKPLPGLRVVAANGGKPIKATTKKNGAYLLRLKPGHWTLALEDPKGLWGGWGEAEVAADEATLVNLDATLGARVEIVLRDRIGRAPRPPVASRLYCEEGGPAEGAPQAKTMAVKGRVRHEAAPAGRACRVRLEVTGLPLQRIVGPFDVAAGKTVKLKHEIPWL